jgi:hypothetical protein
VAQPVIAALYQKQGGQGEGRGEGHDESELWVRPDSGKSWRHPPAVILPAGCEPTFVVATPPIEWMESWPMSDEQCDQIGLDFAIWEKILKLK